MSKILEKIAKLKAEKDKYDLGLKLTIKDICQHKIQTRLMSVAGIISFGQGELELDLIPISKHEDDTFCVAGSLLAHYCEQRLKARSAEMALCAIMATSKRMLCRDCGKIYTRCVCKEKWVNIFYSLEAR